MSFENLSDEQVRNIVEATGSFFNTLQIKALLEALNSIAGAAPTSVSWNSLTDVPATFAPTIGTTATTAKAGNYAPPNATTTTRGLVLQGAAVANAAAAPTKAEFDSLLGSLRASGALASA